MRNHAEKQRTMARSVLPSTARKAARFTRRHSHKTARQSIRATLREVSIAEHPDDVDAPLDRYRIDMRRSSGDRYEEQFVGARRAADKTAPLVRWAGAIITRTPQLLDGDYWVRRNHFKSILPDTLPGRHALSHLEGLFGPNDIRSLTWHQQPERHAAADRRDAVKHFDRKSMLTDVVNAAGARRLNERIIALTAPIRMVEVRFSIDDRQYVKTVARDITPWTFDGLDVERWLRKPRHTRRTSYYRGGVYEVDIALWTLAEVHAEMFGNRLAGEPPTP